jgi:hypothetical protein
MVCFCLTTFCFTNTKRTPSLSAARVFVASFEIVEGLTFGEPQGQTFPTIIIVQIFMKTESVSDSTARDEDCGGRRAEIHGSG